MDQSKSRELANYLLYLSEMLKASSLTLYEDKDKKISEDCLDKVNEVVDRLDKIFDNLGLGGSVRSEDVDYSHESYLSRIREYKISKIVDKKSNSFLPTRDKL